MTTLQGKWKHDDKRVDLYMMKDNPTNLFSLVAGEIGAGILYATIKKSGFEIANTDDGTPCGTYSLWKFTKWRFPKLGHPKFMKKHIKTWVTFYKGSYCQPWQRKF